MTAAFTPANRALATLGLSLSMFMQVLDSTIANVSLPTIAGNLGASMQQGTWVITSFAVSNAIALPLTGWLSRRFGEVRLFIGATLLFTLMSLLCGLAANMGSLVVFRALQGFAAGPIYPVSQALMIAIFPPHKRAMALALLSMVVVTAPILGPILGGWITDNYAWPWIFLINIPVGLFASYVTWAQLRRKPEQTQRSPMDYVGLITLALGVGALQILLDTGNDEDWFESNLIITLAIVSAISIAVFLIWELTEKHPIVDLRIFRHRNFTAGALGYTFAYAFFIGSGLLIPLWLQAQMGYSAFWAGLACAPAGLLPVLLAPLVGKYSHRADLRLLSTFALLVIGAIFYARSLFTLDVDFALVAWLQLLQGIGIALMFMPMLTIMLSDLHGDEIAAGSGLAVFLRALGGSFAVSITTYLWNHRAIQHHAHLADQFAPSAPATRMALEIYGQGDARLALSRLEGLITQQAYQIAFNEVFYLFAFMMVAMILLVWIAKPPFFRSMTSTAPSVEH